MAKPKSCQKKLSTPIENRKTRDRDPITFLFASDFFNFFADAFVDLIFFSFFGKIRDNFGDETNSHFFHKLSLRFPHWILHYFLCFKIINWCASFFVLERENYKDSFSRTFFLLKVLERKDVPSKMKHEDWRRITIETTTGRYNRNCYREIQ